MALILVLVQVSFAETPEETRARAWNALQARVSEAKYLKHALGVEAIMRAMAGPKDNREEWGLAGLLHDFDITTTADDLSRHGIVAAPILRDLGFSEAVVYAVSAHDDHTGIPRKTRMDHALFCADRVYWVISDAGLRFPSEALDRADPRSVWEQAKTKPDKAAILSETSNECQQIGLAMPEALESALTALRKVSLPLGIR